MEERISTLLLSTSKTGIFKSPFTSGLSIFGTSIFPSTFDEIPPEGKL
jgi:hypothetical protein